MNNATTYTNVTLYTKSSIMGSIKKIECRKLSIAIVKFVQYSNAVSLKWLAKGQRKEREDIQTNPNALVLDGWGHPDPDSVWDESTRRVEGVITVVHGRYRSFDSRWQGDFDAKIGAYVAEGRGKILADYRKHIVV